MEASSNLFEHDAKDILSTILGNADGVTYVVDPSETSMKALVEANQELGEDATEVKLLADGRTVRSVMKDFLVASSAADLVADDRLAIRTTTDDAENTLVVTRESVVTLVSAGGQTAGLRTTETGFVTDVNEAYGERWEHAETHTLRTPPISAVRETLGAEVGPDVRSDFDDVLASLETARGDNDSLDEVTVSLLVAAKNQELFYDVSKWGEDVGVASKATFSRVKNDLEDAGLLATEKVPVEVGRPRQRLTIANRRLAGASGDQLATVAQSLL